MDFALSDVREINKRAAYGYYSTAAARPMVRRVIDFVKRFR